MALHRTREDIDRLVKADALHLAHGAGDAEQARHHAGRFVSGEALSLDHVAERVGVRVCLSLRDVERVGLLPIRGTHLVSEPAEHHLRLPCLASRDRGVVHDPLQEVDGFLRSERQRERPSDALRDGEGALQGPLRPFRRDLRFAAAFRGGGAGLFQLGLELLEVA